MVSNLRTLNGLLVVIAVLLGANVYVQLAGTRGLTSAALAQEAEKQGIPDEGAQLNEIIRQLKLLNKSTEEVVNILKKGKVRVVSEPAPMAEGAGGGN